MTLLSDIISSIQILNSKGSLEIGINGLAIDSRKVKTGYLFGALRGSQLDGHDYIEKSIELGANVIVCEELPDHLHENVTYLKVTNSVESFALMTRDYFDNPAEDMKMIGITGTNGKTTVATLAWQLIQLLGMKAGLFSTVDVRIGEESLPATHTTPDVIQLYKRLKEMRDAGCEYVLMEVSSHALDQKRVFGLNFDIAVFTNATRDHLDYHGDFKAYLNAKKLLFDGLKKGATAIICQDDKHADYMIQNTVAEIKTYGLRSFGELHGRLIENNIDGLTLQIDQVQVAFRMAGAYNAQNLLAAYGIAKTLDFEQYDILEKWSLLTGAEGRFDQIKKNGITAIVDYAHTPDALENILNNINEMRSDRNTLITIIGCGGDRDRGKRPMMAKVASEKSDLTILTSDNPRTENPSEIIEEMFVGVSIEKQSKTFKITGREEAIKLGCQLAKEGDIIVVAGKGHEKYQD
ncbi:UNVERIFIED_CONTAM: hypothetical protein GTU68_024477, partial [Idotea baltica]|nr:hypothetical protein [Idotea baltica]